MRMSVKMVWNEKRRWVVNLHVAKWLEVRAVQTMSLVKAVGRKSCGTRRMIGKLHVVKWLARRS